MTTRHEALALRIAARFGDCALPVPGTGGEVTFEVAREHFVDVCRVLRDDPDFSFETLIDLCGVDYLTYGRAEWDTSDATHSGFSRAADRPVIVPDDDAVWDPRRFAVVYHLLSIRHNCRLRLRVFTGPENPPVVASVIDIWRSADWFEREAFDLFGILFDGHPDLRRILTDYGFVGHPFRKDFPTSGNVEVRYDPDKGRVVYQPVTIEPRVLVPRIVREDNRYDPGLKGPQRNG
ncbi:MAG: NADH-quinone oxidoreductase subunit C [Gammaproteobacteria bacterium]|nr:NADH-quinone oxidoreductase subunit C [Gammaproteobacteria bacterium]